MATETAVRATITSTIMDLLATNADDPAGFITIDYPRRIDHALQMFGARIPLIGRKVLQAATAPHGVTSSILPYTFNITDADFADIIAVYTFSDTRHVPHRYIPAHLSTDGNNPQVILYDTQVAQVAIGESVVMWYYRTWSLPALPTIFYPIIAEGAAGYAMRAQALAFMRQATIRQNNASLLFAQADAAIASFHAQIENARANRHRMQIHNDNVMGLRLNDTKFAIDQQRIANIQGGIAVAAQLLDREYITEDQGKRIVQTFDDDLIQGPGATVNSS